MRFPLRGHSYLDCNRDMDLIELDLPTQWHQIVIEAQQKPHFSVIEWPQILFLGFASHIKGKHKASCSVPNRPVSELLLEAQHPHVRQVQRLAERALADSSGQATAALQDPGLSTNQSMQHPYPSATTNTMTFRCLKYPLPSLIMIIIQLLGVAENLQGCSTDEDTHDE